MQFSYGEPMKLSKYYVVLLTITVLGISVLGATMYGNALKVGGYSYTGSSSENEALGNKLASKFLQLLKENDQKGLSAFLSDGFQIQRSDGSGANKVQYLQKMPIIERFRISSLTATRQGNFLVVRYNAEIQGYANGKRYRAGIAPRISTFVRTTGDWQLLSHANFNPLEQAKETK
jgi:hypothetical protein